MGRLLALFAVTAGAFAQNFVTFDISAPSGLQANAIRILDDGHPEPVVYWHANRSPHITVVVLNLSYAPVKSFAWTSAIRTMRRLEASEYLYFYVVTKQGALLPVHSMPGPDSAAPLGHTSWIDRTLPPLESTLALESPTDRRPAAGMSNYLELVSRMALFSGPKTLVCVGCLLERSADWTPRHGADPAVIARSVELRQLGDALNQARVAVYPVAGRPASGSIGAGNGPGVERPLTDLSPDAISGFSGLTGGRAFNFGEVDQAITQAIEDGKSTYRVAYLPPPANWNGKPHKLTVTSSRSRSHVLAPSWYLAGRLEDIAREVRPPIPDTAITSPFEQSGIGLSVSPPTIKGDTMRVVVRVETADLLLFDRNGRHSGSLALQLLSETPEGRPMALTEPKIVSLDLDAQELDTALRGGLRFPFDLPAASTGARIRVVAHDEYSGETGTVTFVPGAEH